MCGFTQEYITYDLAASGFAENIVTEHENMFMEQGIKIKFLIAKNHGRVSALPPIVPKESETEEIRNHKRDLKERKIDMKAICGGRLVMH